MSDNELLLALSDIMDKKLKPIDDRLSKMENDMNSGLNIIKIILENEIRPDIKLLAEHYLPSANRYEKATFEFEVMKNDIELQKKVVIAHSEKLQMIS
jgi:hypothetical protein